MRYRIRPQGSCHTVLLSNGRSLSRERLEMVSNNKKQHLLPTP
eukprot:gene11998-8267_t